MSLVYELKPLVLLLLMPPVPLLILMALGAGLLAKRRRIGRILLILGFAGGWLSCTEGVAQLLAEHLLKVPPALAGEEIAALRTESQEKHTVAVFVLGAGVRSVMPEYGGGPGLRALTLERLRLGIWLARGIEAPLGFSGGIGWGDQAHQEVTEASVAARTAMEEFGLPLRWAEDQARDTVENARLSVPLLRADGIRTLVLVSTDMHMPRALQAFGHAAAGQLRIVPAPASLRAGGPLRFSDWCPSNDGFTRVRYAIYEGLGLLAGR